MSYRPPPFGLGNGRGILDSAIDYKQLYKQLHEQKTINNSPFTEEGLPRSFVDFNKLIGLPKHPATLAPMNMMPFQVAYANTVIRNRGRFNKYHVNKSRQIGFTETQQRFFAWQAFSHYKGKKILNIAGTREKTTKKIFVRLRRLFDPIENMIADNGTDLYFKLKNGAEFEGLPSNSEAIRGDTKIAAVGIDEAGHFGIADDGVVIDAVMPIIDTNMAELFMYSTPNGRRGFFYEVDITSNDVYKIKLPIWVTQGLLYTAEQINKFLARKDVDVEQEYLNQYTTYRHGVFGSDFEHEDFAVEDWTHL